VVSLFHKGNLPDKLAEAAGTSNSSYGWIGGGRAFNPAYPFGGVHSFIIRIDFANDTAEAQNVATSSFIAPNNFMSYPAAFNAAANGAT